MSKRNSCPVNKIRYSVPALVAGLVLSAGCSDADHGNREEPASVRTVQTRSDMIRGDGQVLIQAAINNYITEGAVWSVRADDQYVTYRRKITDQRTQRSAATSFWVPTDVARKRGFPAMPDYFDVIGIDLRLSTPSLDEDNYYAYLGLQHKGDNWEGFGQCSRVDRAITVPLNGPETPHDDPMISDADYNSIVTQAVTFQQKVLSNVIADQYPDPC